MNTTLFGEQTLRTDEPIVLFAFDDRCVPWTRGVYLTMHQPVKHAANPIVPRGDVDAPDGRRATSPSVVRIGDRWRMWYVAFDADWPKGTRRVAVADSSDGINWTKPDLGLIEVNGSRDNNLVDAAPGLAQRLAASTAIINAVDYYNDVLKGLAETDK